MTMRKQKPRYTFRDFILGADHLCVKCNQYAHRDNYSFYTHTCDNCGINRILTEQIAAAINQSEQSKQ